MPIWEAKDPSYPSGASFLLLTDEDIAIQVLPCIYVYICIMGLLLRNSFKWSWLVVIRASLWCSFNLPCFISLNNLWLTRISRKFNPGSEKLRQYVKYHYPPTTSPPPSFPPLPSTLPLYYWYVSSFLLGSAFRGGHLSHLFFNR